MVIDSSGNVYTGFSPVCSSSATLQACWAFGEVHRISPAGVRTIVQPSRSSDGTAVQVTKMRSMAQDHAANLYFSDVFGDVRRLSPDGEGQPAGEPTAHITGVAAEAHPDPVDRPDQSTAAAAAGALAALAKLPDNQRQALILTKVHGRSIADAAMITGSTPGAIKQRAHRAYVTLRQMLGRKEVA